MGYESCVEKYGGYFSPLIKEIFQENDLPVPYILELLKENCLDYTCKHNVFYDDGKTTLRVRQHNILPWVNECRSCMCLLDLMENCPSPEEIGKAFGINRWAVRKHLNSGLKKIQKTLKLNSEMTNNEAREIPT